MRADVVGLVLILVLAGAACSSEKQHASTTTAPAAGTTGPAGTGSAGTSTTSSPPASSSTTTTGTGSTTATTVPAPAGLHAVSATFVSPADGWVLATATDPIDCGHSCRSDILRTADGGRTWGLLARGPDAVEGATIRFADARHGYVVSGASLFGTNDGGSTWRRDHVAFRPLALEVANRIVNVVGWVPNQQDVHVWTDRVGMAGWSQTSASMPLGAGPEAFVSLALTHGRGWLVYDNRVEQGAQRSTQPGQWSPWSVSCDGGPANVTASSATDVVVGCAQGEWTSGPPQPKLLVSTDAGAHFTKRNAPGYGAIASPRTGVAVIALGGRLARTADSGATWQTVYRVSDSDSGFGDELGFTTRSQGFAITAAGTMLMSRDAGASWSAIAL
jgi:photosystem II stability/assembly factor-like uncharacterized protein